VRQFLSFAKTMVIGGLVFLFPLVFVVIIVSRAFTLLVQVSRPVVDTLSPVHTVADVAVIDLVAILALLAGCLVAGLVARSGIGRTVYGAVDASLARVIPGYAIWRARLGDAVGHEAQRRGLKTIVVRMDDYDQIALEIERLPDGRVVVFLPGAPDLWTGQSIVVDAARVTRIDIDILPLGKLMQNLGWGTGNLLKGGSAATPER
jgi:uncharacterized membrane protein